MPKGLYTSIILSIQYVHGDLCKHLGIDSSTDSSMCGTLEFLTSLPVQDGGPHDVRSKMAAPTTPRWRPPRNQDGGPCDAFGYTSEGESTP